MNTPRLPPAPTWPAPPATAPRSQRRLLGVRRWVWLAAWLPVVPVALFALWMPGFLSPLLDAWPATAAVLGLLVLANLGAGRSQSDTRPVVAVALTTGAGFVFAFVGPLVFLVAGGVLGL